MSTKNDKIEKLRSKLPHNWQRQMMARTGRGSTYLSSILNEWREDEREFVELLKLAEEYQAHLKKQREEISNYSNTLLA